jgi:hypothetical protein
MDFAANGQEAGTKGSEIKIKGRQQMKIFANVAAYLPREPMDSIQKKQLEGIYWNIERSRVGESRNVQVELIVNGRPVDTATVVADGKINKVNFDYSVDRSCWMALRIFESAHSNPIFVTVDGKPIHEKRSAEWCRDAVDQCWKMKSGNMRPDDRAQAAIVYARAKGIYESIIKEAETNK